jgi:hypothetical protein
LARSNQRARWLCQDNFFWPWLLSAGFRRRDRDRHASQPRPGKGSWNPVLSTIGIGVLLAVAFGLADANKQWKPNPGDPVVRIQTSDGKYWHIHKGDLAEAQKRDPGLKVSPEAKHVTGEILRHLLVTKAVKIAVKKILGGEAGRRLGEAAAGAPGSYAGATLGALVGDKVLNGILSD